MLVDGSKLVGVSRQAKEGAGRPAARTDAAKATPPSNSSGASESLRLMLQADGAPFREARRQCGR